MNSRTVSRKDDESRPLVEEWSYEETFLPKLGDYLKMSREFREWVARDLGIPIDWEDGAASSS